jgi:hypothetical protein
MSQTWPKRQRSPTDDAMLTIAGGSTYLARQRGSLNGFYDPAAPPARDAAYESTSQKRDKEAARRLRLQWGAESWQTVATAFAEERLRELEAENVLHSKRKATDNAEEA